MTTFDVEKARAEHRVTEIYDHVFPAALAEIERLRGEVIKANHRYQDLQEICDGNDDQIQVLQMALFKEKCARRIIDSCRFGIKLSVGEMKRAVFNSLKTSYPNINWEGFKNVAIKE